MSLIDLQELSAHLSKKAREEYEKEFPMPATEVNGLERDFGPFGDDASPAPKYNTIDVIHKPAEAPLVTKAVAILTFGVLAVVGGIAWGMTGGRH